MEPLARDAGKEVGSPLEAGEEVRLCTDAEGNPVVLGRGSWGHIYLATRWGTQVCPPCSRPPLLLLRPAQSHPPTTYGCGTGEACGIMHARLVMVRGLRCNIALRQSVV